MNPMKRDFSPQATLIIVALIAAFTILGVTVGEDFVIPMVIVSGALAAYLSKTDVGRALAHRLRHGPEPIEASHEMYGELDDLRNRVGELEERLDFAERLLAQPRDAAATRPLDVGRAG
jgi:hypothetical protein